MFLVPFSAAEAPFFFLTRAVVTRAPFSSRSAGPGTMMVRLFPPARSDTTQRPEFHQPNTTHNKDHQPAKATSFFRMQLSFIKSRMKVLRAQRLQARQNPKRKHGLTFGVIGIADRDANSFSVARDALLAMSCHVGAPALIGAVRLMMALEASERRCTLLFAQCTRSRATEDKRWVGETSAHPNREYTSRAHATYQHTRTRRTRARVRHFTH